MYPWARRAVNGTGPAGDPGPSPSGLSCRSALWREHLCLGPGGGPLLLDPRQGFERLRKAAEGGLERPHHIAPYDPTFRGDDLELPGAPPPYDPANPNHEIVRTHLIDPDGRNPDDPALDYFALLALIGG